MAMYGIGDGEMILGLIDGQVGLWFDALEGREQE